MSVRPGRAGKGKPAAQDVTHAPTACHRSAAFSRRARVKTQGVAVAVVNGRPRLSAKI